MTGFGYFMWKGKDFYVLPNASIMLTTSEGIEQVLSFSIFL